MAHSHLSRDGIWLELQRVHKFQVLLVCQIKPPNIKSAQPTMCKTENSLLIFQFDVLGRRSDLRLLLVLQHTV
jgi:hypothetical protein